MPLIEVRFLIPIVRNSDRRPHPVGIWQELERKLHAIPPDAGIYRRIRTVWGEYQSNEGIWVADDSRCYAVFLNSARIVYLEAVLGWAHKAFDQEDGIYMSVAGYGMIVKPSGPAIARPIPESTGSEVPMGAGAKITTAALGPECVFYWPVTDPQGKPYHPRMLARKDQVFRKLVRALQGPESVPLLSLPITEEFKEIDHENKGNRPPSHATMRSRPWTAVRMALPPDKIDAIRLFLRRCHNAFGLDKPIPFCVAGIVEGIVGGAEDGNLFDYENEL